MKIASSQMAFPTTALLFLSAPALIAPARSVDALSLTSDGIRLTALPNGNIQVSDREGKPRLTMGDYRLAWVPPATAGGVATLQQTPDGQQAIQVLYKVKDDPTGKIRIQGTFTVSPYRVHVRYDIWGPDDLRVGGAMLACQPQSHAPEPTKEHLAHWERDPQGGQPFEVPDGTALAYPWTDSTRMLVSLNKSNLNWSSATTMHFPPGKTESGHFVAEGDIFLLKLRPSAVAAFRDRRPFSLDLYTEKPFNLWDGADQPLLLNVELNNVAATTRKTLLSYQAYDFNGKIVAQGKTEREVPSIGIWDYTIALPAPKRGILFVEVQARSGEDVVFSRTTVGVLPPYTFKAGNKSLFGISAYFPEPSAESAEAMLCRIGVRWLRQRQMPAAEAKAKGLSQNYHSNISAKTAGSNTPTANAEWIAKQLKEADAAGASYWEACNEWNMSGGVGSGTTAALYVEKILIPAANARKASGAKVKLMSVGLAGGDPKFIDNMYAAGAWKHFDAFALHPGRGNYTPDYTDDYWNFLGTIRGVKEKLAKYGNKPLWITEGYACNQPNSWWHDTTRHAAENLVLSYALAAAEGVRVMNWYQFNDTVWWNVGAANPKDSEFYYGLVNRDLSPKPSLLAYENIAKALDQAKFTRYLTFPDDKQKGILFSTPHGPLTILWHRADGYILNTNHPRKDKWYAEPPPWLDDWKTKVTVTLPATGSEVRVLDCIGQETKLPVQNGKVTVTLDGAPRLFYGLVP
jgi:hypothetical protein